MTSHEVAAAQQAERPAWERLLQPVISQLAQRLRGRYRSISAEDIRRAGFDPARLTVEDVLAIKVLSALVAAAAMLAFAVAIPAALMLVPAGCFAAFLAPSVVISRRSRARKRRILNELPDVVGLLKAFVSTGIPLEQALHLISSQLAAGGSLLGAEIRQALSDYGLGLSIDTALETMARRTGLEELELLAGALAQGKRQGTGMERILRDQEQIVRVQQRNRATVEASRVSTRLVGVLVLVYLPEFMVLIMVPLFYGIFLRAFG